MTVQGSSKLRLAVWLVRLVEHNKAAATILEQRGEAS